MYKPEFRCSRRGVPILSHEEIEQDAEMFIKDYNADLLVHPGELDIEGFSEFYLGLNPRFFCLTNYGGILGRMIFNDNHKIPIYVPEEGRADYYEAERGEILIDSSLQNDEHRIRSTMGHESGHWIYQQSYYYVDPYQMTLFTDMDKTSTACKKTDLEGGSGKKNLVTDHDWLEHQANYFSAAILMPRTAMRIVCQDPMLRRGICNEFPGEELNMLAYRVSDVFNVSEESARIRIQQLNLDFDTSTAPKMFFTLENVSGLYSL